MVRLGTIDWIMKLSRLKWVNDGCAIDSRFPLNHWPSKWQKRVARSVMPILDIEDGYVITVIKNRIFCWFRAFTLKKEPHQWPESTSWFTLREWAPTLDSPAIPGWISLPARLYEGVTLLSAPVTKNWGASARRQLKQCEKTGVKFRYGDEADLEILMKRSQVPRGIRKIYIELSRKHHLLNPEELSYLVAEYSGEPIAIMVVGWLNELKHSYYLTGAFDVKHGNKHGMVGLINWWFNLGLEKEMRSHSFGELSQWYPWPLGWYVTPGYSLFKTQFGTQRIWSPKIRWRLKG